jgi:DNA-binding phage protein
MKLKSIAKVAKAAGIDGESLYRASSSHGDPRLSTLVARHQGNWAETLTVEAAR